MRILALDLATATGWALWASWGEVEYGTVRLPKTGEDVGRFLLAFEGWLAPRLTEWKVELVVFEMPILPQPTQMATLRKLYGLAGVTEMVAIRAGVDVCEKNLSTIRKHFIGCGTGPREVMKRLTVEECRRRGWDPEDDNAADALALLDLAGCLLCEDWPWRGGSIIGSAA